MIMRKRLMWRRLRKLGTPMSKDIIEAWARSTSALVGADRRCMPNEWWISQDDDGGIGDQRTEVAAAQNGGAQDVDGQMRPRAQAFDPLAAPPVESADA